MRVLYFGTYERDYPRNAQVISALRRAGVEVIERHVGVWENSRQNWSAGPVAAARLALAELRLLRRPREEFDAVLVGYPGHFDLPAARRTARGRPVVFNPLVSLSDTLVADRGRFRDGSLPARTLARIDRRALRSADLVVADTRANAEHLAELAEPPAARNRGLLRRRGGAPLRARLGARGAVHRALRREADPTARPGDDSRRRPRRARPSLPHRRQRPARESRPGAARERRVGSLGGVRAPSRRAPPRRLRARASSAPRTRRCA